MKKNTCILLCLFLSAISLLAQKRDIGQSWLFFQGEQPEAQTMLFDDSEWRCLDLPHDWAFEYGYHPDGAQKDKGGYACGGIGWYRKHFVLSKKELQSAAIHLDFDAVYRNAKVWLNGHYLGTCPYGYLPFSFEITPYTRSGENILAVRVDNALEPSARWYHGCGIYGNVYLRTNGKVYFQQYGTHLFRMDCRGHLSVKALVNNIEQQSDLFCQAEVYDLSGNLQACVKTPLLAQREDTVKLSMQVNEPKLWSPEHPHLYQLHLSLLNKKRKILAEQNIRFGFRELEWNIQRGFFLNGEQYKLRGVCEHLEGGPTGAVYTPQLMRWKLQLLKDMGCNAVRTAHNPQLPFFYDLCDEMGLLVLDEVFDGWKQKADYDYGQQAFQQHWEADLRTVIRRDRNHPSVFLYSVGNETRGPMAADMVKVCHEEDSTRRVTSGTAGTDAMDIMGVNGNSEAKKFLDTFQPTSKPFIATENPHTWQVRGYYRTLTWYRDGYHPQKQQMMFIPNLTEKEIFTYDWISPAKRRNRKQIFNSSYDNATVRVTTRHILEALRDKEWFSGSFRWTGFDYPGEAGYVHGGWPFRAFQSGALDLAGFPKDLYYLYQSEWSNKDMAHILPHWTHPMMKPGTKIPVWVYTSGDEVELFLNGKSLGRCAKGKSWNNMQCQFMVPWQSGRLEAVAFRKGQEIARDCQITAEAPCQLDVTVENNQLKADGQDISIMTLSEVDRNGVIYPYGENRIHVSISGDARVLSFENGSPVDTERNFEASSRCCFFGLNRLFVQSTGGKEKAPVSVLLGAIVGDKKLKQSDRVHLVFREIALRGNLPDRHIAIYYTTDGTVPTVHSACYTAPFPIKPGTCVKAAIYDGENLLFNMEEAFGPDEGLYWGSATDTQKKDDVMQAEELDLTDCKVLRDEADSMAYVVPSSGKGELSWYQENDGGKEMKTLTIRYALSEQEKEAVMGLYNNRKLIRKIDFKQISVGKSQWQECKITVPIYSGANQITLRSLSPDGAPRIDYLKLE